MLTVLPKELLIEICQCFDNYNDIVRLSHTCGTFSGLKDSILAIKNVNKAPMYTTDVKKYFSKKLEIYPTNVKSDFLKELTNVEELYMYGIYMDDDLSYNLSLIKGLKYLVLDNCRVNIVDEMHNLLYLRCNNCNGVDIGSDYTCVFHNIQLIETYYCSGVIVKNVYFVRKEKYIQEVEDKMGLEFW